MMYEEDWTLLGIAAVLALGAATCAGTCATGCNRGYSEGVRIGVVYKLSHRGLMWKTWEGEMNLGGVANTWNFTVVDDKWLPVLQVALESGRPVKIKYIEWFIAKQPVTASGYEVVDVTQL